MSLASHLHMPLQRCKQETSSMEFLVWNEYLMKKHEEETKRHSKQEYYLAQIAMEVYRSNRPKASVRLNKFLLKFHIQKEVNLEAMTDEEYEAAKKEAAERSKMYWKMFLGGVKK